MSELDKSRSYSFLRPLFREAALARRGQTEVLDGLLRVTAPHEWVALAMIGIVLVSILLWGVFGRVEQSVAARCVFIESGTLSAVRSAAEGTVAEIERDVGDEVRIGDPIALLRLPELEMQAATARARIAILEEDLEPARATIALAHAELEGVEAMLESSRYVSSPSAGTLVWSKLEVGQTIGIEEDVALVRADTGSLHVLAFVDPGDAARISVGMKAQIAPVSPSDDVASLNPNPDNGSNPADGSNPNPADGSNPNPDNGSNPNPDNGSNPGSHTRPDSEAGTVNTEAKVVSAVVSQVAEPYIPSSDWLARVSGFAVPVDGVPVTLDLSDPEALGVVEGDLCRMRITVARDSPVGLIAHARPATPQSL